MFDLFKLCPFSAIEVEEEAWLNKKERCLRLHSYNVTWSKYASLEEFSTYRACDNNPDWYLTIKSLIQAIQCLFIIKLRHSKLFLHARFSLIIVGTLCYSERRQG